MLFSDFLEQPLGQSLLRPSPPAVIALVLGGLDLAHQTKTFASRPLGVSREQESEETLVFAKEAFYDILTVGALAIAANFLYNNGMRAFSWALVVAPLITIVATIVLCIYELKRIRD